MPADDDALHAALTALAAQDASQLIGQARSAARERVHELLVAEWERAMLAAVSRALAPAPDRGDAQLVYVYGIIAADAAPTDLPEGVGGRRPRTVSESGLAAVVGDVPAGDFDEQRLREHLADMTWVETTARAHERVLDAVRAAATVVPMRMCSVYSDQDGVRALLTREATALHDALRALADKTEWGVKVYRDPAAQLATAPSAVGEASGAQYMQRRVREREAQVAAAGRLQESLAAIHEALGAIAADALIAAPQRAEVSGRSAEMVLNGIYLVPDRAIGDFRARLDALGAEFSPQGLEIELTGPWPAYNFVPGTIGAAW